MSRAGFLLAVLVLFLLVGLIAFITLRPADPAPLKGVSSDRTETPARDLPARPLPAPPPVPSEPVDPAAGETAGRAVPGAIVGTVLGVAGEPANGVEVYAAGADDVAVIRAEVKSWTKTGEDGGFRLFVLPGVTDLLVVLPGALPAVREGIEVSAGIEHDVGVIRLEAGRSLAGHVVDTEARPVDRVEVVAYRDDSLRSPALLPARRGLPAWGGRNVTDDTGAFTIPGLGREPLLLRVQGRPDIVMASEPLQAVPGARNVRIVVRRLRVGTGRVVKEDGETGVAGATVTLEVREGGGALIFRTAGDGRFAFDLSEKRYGLEQIRFDLLVSAEGFEDLSLTELKLADLLPEAKLLVTLVTAVPQEPGRLRGRVLYDTGDPFEGSFTLSFSRKGKAGQVFRVETDENGAFLIEGVTPGEYVLRTAARRSRLLKETGTILIVPPGGEESTDFTFERGGDVEIRVRGPSGEPVEGTVVHLLGEKDEALDSIPLTGGAVKLLDLSPGEVRLRITAPGHREERRTAMVEKDRVAEVTVALEESR